MKNFKKLLYIFIFVFSFFTFLLKVNAATLNVKISASSNKVVVGDTVTYTVTVSSSEKLGSIIYNFTYDSSKLEWKSGETKSVYVTPDGSKKSATFTFKFKAKASGTATVKFNIDEAIDFNDNAFSYNSSTSRSTTIITQSQLTQSYSKNNYMSNLKVEGFDLTPAFNKETLEYSLTLENDVRNINITGSKEDSRSTVTGLGSHELEEGINKINIVCTAQNGSSRTYIINVTVKELSPIIVEANGMTLSVVRKKEQLVAPNSNFVEVFIKIGDADDVPALYNEAIDTTLVGLKDEDGNVSLYTYKDDKYQYYREFAFNSIIVTNINSDNVPDGYEKKTIKINDQDVTAYHEDGNDDFYIFSATNISNGEKHLYQYNANENTIQIFDERLFSKIDDLNVANKNYFYVIIGLGTLLIVTYLAILISSIRKRNAKNYAKKSEKSKKIEENDKEIETKDKNNDKIKEDISKKKREKK